ncbi:BAR adaptor protein Hob3 [Tilletia horrida]|nr:BAR adaptor protein Hob3 [Tilletia horrida]
MSDDSKRIRGLGVWRGTVYHTEFAEEDASYRTLEKETIACRRRARRTSTPSAGFPLPRPAIGEAVAGFYNKSSEAATAATAYKRAAEELDGKCCRELDAPFPATIFEPIGWMCSYLSEIKKTSEKRNRKLLDHDAARTKHRKLVEKPSDDPSKAEREMEDAKILFEQLSNQLLEKLPQRIDLRIPYLDPSVDAMVRMQARFAGYEKMGGVEGVLQEMRELSICGTGN